MTNMKSVLKAIRPNARTGLFAIALSEIVSNEKLRIRTNNIFNHGEPHYFYNIIDIIDLEIGEQLDRNNTNQEAFTRTRKD